MQGVIDELENLNLGALWDAMPPSWQTDITHLVHSFAENVDRKQYRDVVRIVERMRDVIRDRQDILALSPIWRNAIGDGDPQAAHRALTYLLESGARTSESLSSIDLSIFVRTRLTQSLNESRKWWGSDTSRENKLHLITAVLRELRVEDVTRDGSTRTMKLHGLEDVARFIGEPARGLSTSDATFDVTLYEDCWVPVGMLEEWPAWMARARAEVAALSNYYTPAQRDEFSRGVQAADNCLSRFETAKSSSDVNRAIGKAMAFLMKLGR